ncbi:MAG: DinB family protein [Terracidiphilus sp.]|nr:DinB family protein [Terracidiphilus sp.]
MSALNPYEHFLTGRPVQEILAATAAQLGLLIAAIGADRTSTPPAPGKWSAAEIVCHLADCELVFAFRLRQTLAENAPTIQPFDQEKWAMNYSGISIAQALEVFSALRAWNLLLIRGALPEAFNRRVTHPERGAMTFSTILETMAGHDLNHLGQLQKLAASTAG